MRTPLRLLFLLVCLLAARGLTAQQPPPLDAALTALTQTNVIRAGATARLAMRVVLDKSLHVQSNTPSDPGFIATVLTVDPPAGVTVDELVYPAATALTQFGQPEPLSVYGHDFVIGVQVTLAPNVAPGTLVISARLRYQACNDTVCFRPLTEAVPWIVEVVPAGTAVTPQHQAVFAGIAFGKGIKPPPRTAEAAPAAPAPTPAGGGADGVAALDKFTLQLATGGYLGTNDFLTFIKDAESGTKPSGLFDNRGPLAILLIVLVGGLALNLTPCVLPMIPINLAIIGAGAKAGSRSRGFVLGASYGAAMAVVYGVLGLVVILTAGTFGAINSSPWFNLSIAVLFVALGLAMFDVLMIDFSKFSTAFQPSSTAAGKRGPGLHDGQRRGAAGRRLRGACRDSGGALRERPVCEGQRRGARIAVCARTWHGPAVAHRRCRHGGPAETRRVDGTRQASIRRRHPADRRVLRLPRLHVV